MPSHPGYSLLADLTRIKPATTARLSSWDRSGRNQDYWLIPPHSKIAPGRHRGTRLHNPYLDDAVLPAFARTGPD